MTDSKLPFANCAGCPAFQGRPLAPIGKGRRLAIVGEAPTRTDVRAGRIFSGTADRQLGRMLKANNLTPADIHWTNAIACECRLKDRQKAAKHCRPRLTAELADAEVVVALGSHATKSAALWVKNTPIQRWRGTVCERPALEGSAAKLVLPIMSPYEVVQTPRWMPIWEADWQRVARVAAKGFTPPELLPGKRLIVARNEVELLAGLDRINWGGLVAADVETLKAPPTETPLVCHGMSDGDTSIVIPWSKASNGQEPYWSNPGWVIGEVNKRMTKATMVTHNGPGFDHIVLARYGFTWGAWEDTLLATHVLGSHLPKTLAHVVTVSGLDVPPWKEQDSLDADMSELMSYNLKDSTYTALMAPRVLELLK